MHRIDSALIAVAALVLSSTLLAQTTIIVASHQNVIYIGADALMVDDSLRVRSDRACKIGHTTSFCFAGAGIYHSALVYLDLDTVMRAASAFSTVPKVAIDTAICSFAVRLCVHVEEQLRRRHSQDTSAIIQQSQSTIAFAWFEDGVANLKIVEFIPFASSGKIYVKPDVLSCTTDCALHPFGITTAVSRIIAQDHSIEQLPTAQAVYKLLVAQTAATPQLVGGTLRVLRIDENGHTWVYGGDGCFR